MINYENLFNAPYGEQLTIQNPTQSNRNKEPKPLSLDEIKWLWNDEVVRSKTFKKVALFTPFDIDLIAVSEMANVLSLSNRFLIVEPVNPAYANGKAFTSKVFWISTDAFWWVLKQEINAGFAGPIGGDYKHSMKNLVEALESNELGEISPVGWNLITHKQNNIVKDWVQANPEFGAAFISRFYFFPHAIQALLLSHDKWAIDGLMKHKLLYPNHWVDEFSTNPNLSLVQLAEIISTKTAIRSVIIRWWESKKLPLIHLYQACWIAKMNEDSQAAAPFYTWSYPTVTSTNDLCKELTKTMVQQYELESDLPDEWVWELLKPSKEDAHGPRYLLGKK